MVALNDAILALRGSISMDTFGEKIIINTDVKGDGKIGLEETIYTLQMIAGIRSE